LIEKEGVNPKTKEVTKVMRGEYVSKSFKIPKFSLDMVEVLLEKYWDFEKLEKNVIF
jgi:hypothetical protein